MVKLESDGIVVEAETVRKAERELKRQLAKRDAEQDAAHEAAYAMMGKLVGRTNFRGLLLVQDKHARAWCERMTDWTSAVSTSWMLNLSGDPDRETWKGRGINVVAILTHHDGRLCAARVSDGYWFAYGVSGDHWSAVSVEWKHLPACEAAYQHLVAVEEAGQRDLAKAA